MKDILKVLVVNTLGVQVDAGIRSLVDSGYVVDIACPGTKKRLHMLASKYINEIFYVERPLKDITTFKENIIDLLQKKKYSAILPFGFETTVALSKIKNDIDLYVSCFLADFELIKKVHDKKELHTLLGNDGFNVPNLYDSDVLEQNKKISFPVVVKARKGCGIKKGVRYAENHEELTTAIKQINSEAKNYHDQDIEDFSNPMIQEYIPGQIYDVLCLVDHGNVIAAMTQIREVTYPLSGGVGANIVVVDDDNLKQYAIEILKHISWNGPCQVEVKKDSRDGSYKLIEINPKLWGTLDLAIQAGFNFPLWAVMLASSKLPSDFCPPVPRIGMKYKIVFPLEIYTIVQDKDHRFLRFLKLFEVFKYNVFSNFYFSDIKPSLLYLATTFYTILFARDRILPKGREFD